MGQTFSKLLFHIIFSTKERMPYLGPLPEDLFPYMGGIIRGIRGKGDKYQWRERSRTHSDFPTHQCLRGGSCTYHQGELFEMGPRNTPRATRIWVAGGIFGVRVSESNLEHVSKYIDGQEEHHRKRSFQEELMALLNKHNLPYDERYMWR